jgi:hypothetical protein
MRKLMAALVFAAFAAAQVPDDPSDPSGPPDPPDPPDPIINSEEPVSSPPVSSPDDKHILEVVPNYATVNEPPKVYQPIRTGEKFVLAAHDSFDPFNWVLAGVYAAAYQKQNRYPQWGQGAQGYAKRYGATFADGAISTYLSEGILPTLLHEDPRYFRLGQGAKWRRIGYAMTRVLITKTDSGGDRFNNSEIVGNLMAAGLGNLYYPPRNRTVGDTLEKFGIGVVSDAAFNVLREFWPDMKRKILHR